MSNIDKQWGVRGFEANHDKVCLLCIEYTYVIIYDEPMDVVYTWIYHGDKATGIGQKNGKLPDKKE